jgi:hypothetical protein
MHSECCNKLIYQGRLNPWVSGKDLILFTIGDIGVDGALYRAMEFCGEAIRSLSMASRFTMANMAIEAGAKNGIMEPDEITEWKWFDIRNLDIYTSSSTSAIINVTYDLRFGEGVLIDWTVNATDGIGWRNETYWYQTTYFTPNVSNPSPYDGQTWMTFNPTLSVNVIDLMGI